MTKAQLYRISLDQIKILVDHFNQLKNVGSKKHGAPGPALDDLCY